jgi:hypothetical protein
MDVTVNAVRLLRPRSASSDRSATVRVSSLLNTLATDQLVVLGSFERAVLVSGMDAARPQAKIHRQAFCEEVATVLREACFGGTHAAFGCHFAGSPLLFFFHVVQTYAGALRMCACPPRFVDAFVREMLDIPANHAAGLDWNAHDAADYDYLFRANADIFFVTSCFVAEKIVAGVAVFANTWPYVCAFHTRFWPGGRVPRKQTLHPFVKSRKHLARTVVAMVVRVYYHFEQACPASAAFTPACGDLAMAVFGDSTLTGVMAVMMDVRATTRGLHRKQYIDQCLRRLHHVMACREGLDARFCAFFRLHVVREALQRVVRKVARV